MGQNTTYHWKGDRSIKLIRTNGKKKSYCLFYYTKHGRKLAPLVIFNPLTPGYTTVEV